MEKVQPPGQRRPDPTLLQREARRADSAPHPPTSSDEDPYGFDESDESDSEAVQPLSDDRSLEDDFVVPPFWGVVRVNDWGGVPGREGFERDNAMRNMLSRDAYVSRRSNSVFVGQSARDARSYERRNGDAYSPFTTTSNNQVYVRAPRGLPLSPLHVKKLRTLYRDGSRRFSDRDRVEAYLLLRELYLVARRVLPINHDRAMMFLMQPNGFDVSPPPFFPVHIMDSMRSLHRDDPPRQTHPPTLGELMSIDASGLYILRYNRPGSSNPIAGIAVDYAFRVGRRSLFGYALGQLLAPIDREATHAFRRQFAFLLALPRRYREAIVAHDRAHPQSPFIEQGGPTYSIHRARLESSHAANISIDDAINALIDNRIPPSWVDHAYAYGVATLNAHYSGSPLNRGLLDHIDNERLARLRRFGAPPAIAWWDGWFCPSSDEVQGIHDMMSVEDTRSSNRGRGDNPSHRQGFDSPAWLLVGQTGVVEYLTQRPRDVASLYAGNHPITLPMMTELGDTTAASSSSGNPLGDLTTTDVDMHANVGIDPPSEAPVASFTLMPAPLLADAPTPEAMPLDQSTSEESSEPAPP
jgi:hypothetical protein